MSTKVECEQDKREKELLELGYTKIEKGYIRLGRAIFVIESKKREVPEETSLSTPLGLAMSLSGKEITKEEYDLLNMLCLSTDYLVIGIEGDPDSGMPISMIKNEILLSAFRFGLDDIFVDGKLFFTVHGDWEEMEKNLKEKYKDIRNHNRFQKGFFGESLFWKIYYKIKYGNPISRWKNGREVKKWLEEHKEVSDNE